MTNELLAEGHQRN